MTLAPGTRLGSYVIRAHLGSGGTGDVHRAEDTRLRPQGGDVWILDGLP